MALETTLLEAPGLRVDIELVGSAERARLTIHLDSFDQMDMIVQKLTRR